MGRGGTVDFVWLEGNFELSPKMFYSLENKLWYNGTHLLGIWFCIRVGHLEA